MNWMAQCRLAIWATLLSICLIPQVQAEGVLSFTNDVMPVLSRFGCNSGGCHGKLAGQNGFKLSLRGYAPDSDFESLARESQGRRINAVAPSESLLIRKAVGALPHGGGKRIATQNSHPLPKSPWLRRTPAEQRESPGHWDWYR